MSGKCQGNVREMSGNFQSPSYPVIPCKNIVYSLQRFLNEHARNYDLFLKDFRKNILNLSTRVYNTLVDIFLHSKSRIIDIETLTCFTYFVRNVKM